MKIVRQRDAKDCGICCLASIIRHYGGYIPNEQLRMDAKANLEGTTALNLILASKKYGFDAVGISCKSLDDLTRLPAVVHLTLKNGLMHYVVIYKILKDKIIIMDPAKGKVIVPKQDFLEKWSKVALMFYPHQKITLLKKENTLLSIFKRVVVSERKLILLIIITSLLLTAFTIMGSYYFQAFASSINNNYPRSFLKILVLIFAFGIFFKVSLSHLRKYLENYLNKNIDCVLNSDFLNHLYNLPLNVITTRTSGEIVTRVNELANVKSLVTDLFVTSTLDLLLLLMTVPLLINISLKLFLILLIPLSLYLIVGLISSKMFFKKAYQNIEYEAEFNSALVEDINMMHSIKNLSKANNRLKRIEKKLINFLYDSFLLNKFLERERTIKECISELTFFLITSLGLYLVLTKSINMLSLVTFNSILSYFFEPIKNIIDALPKYNFLKATITKLNDFLSVDVEKIGNDRGLKNNSISIKNLNYTYNKIDKVITNLSANIKSGEFVLLDGPSGSGKSTLCKILDKYITDYDGDILIGEINIKDLTINTIRSNILYVNQQENIFTGTIKENITLDEEYDDEYFNRVCKICCVDEIVDKKIMRYETGISSDIKNISGGEKQRIILARALLHNFEILILDEALSEVDYKMEEKIISNIKESYIGKTIIYITHKRHHNLGGKYLAIGGSHELS